LVCTPGLLLAALTVPRSLRRITAIGLTRSKIRSGASGYQVREMSQRNSM
jgi:hypothetical protein